MAELAEGRIYKRKRIKNPNDESIYVDIPVIYEAHFKTMQEQAQDSFLYFDNSSQSSRKTHIKRIYFNSNSEFDSSQYVDVERIEEFTIKTMQEQAQEATFVLSNNDPAPLTFRNDGTVDTSIMHEKVHYVRYFHDNDPQSEIWVDVELIDELKIKDMVSQAQEWIYYTKHPEKGDVIADANVPYEVTVGYCDPSLEMAPDESGS